MTEKTLLFTVKFEHPCNIKGRENNTLFIVHSENSHIARIEVEGEVSAVDQETVIRGVQNAAVNGIQELMLTIKDPLIAHMMRFVR